MTSKNLHIMDQRMIELIEILQKKGIIKFKQEFFDAIGMIKQNYRKITSGEIGFTTEQVFMACKEFKVNANWIMGIERKVFRA